MANPKLIIRISATKVAKWKPPRCSRAAKAALMPYQTTRMVAKARNRFCPIPSKIPRFCCTSALTACNTASKKFMVSPWFSVPGCMFLREPVTGEALRQVAVEGSEILGRLLPHLDGEVEVRDVSVSLLFGLENLLLQSGNSQIVCVLKRAQCQHVARIDLVEHADFGVERGIAGKRVLFEIGDLLLDGLRVSANISNGRQCRHVCAIGKFERRIRGF